MNNVYLNTRPYNPMDIETQLAALEAHRQALMNTKITPLSDEIDKELQALSENERSILLSNEEYVKAAEEVQAALGMLLIATIKPQFEASKEGHELLEKQLKVLKETKRNIKQEAQNQQALIQEYITQHSDIPFAEWIKTKTKTQSKK